MAYIDITLDDMDLIGPLEQLEEKDIKELLAIAKEDRSRLIQDGCFIREDWTEAT